MPKDLPTREESALAVRAQMPPGQDGAVDAPLLSLLSDPERLAAFPTEKLEQLITLKNEEEDRLARRQFVQDRVAAEAEIGVIVPEGMVDYKTKGGGRLTSRFAKLEQASAAVDPVLKKYGFAQSFDTEPSERAGCITITYTLEHRSGHEKTYRAADVPHDQTGAKSAIQAIGSTYSYFQRLLKLKVWNVQVGEDLDGKDPAGLEPIGEAEAAFITTEYQGDADGLLLFCEHFRIGDVTELKSQDLREAKVMIVERRRFRRQFTAQAPPDLDSGLSDDEKADILAQERQDAGS